MPMADNSLGIEEKNSRTSSPMAMIPFDVCHMSKGCFDPPGSMALFSP